MSGNDAYDFTNNECAVLKKIRKKANGDELEPVRILSFSELSTRRGDEQILYDFQRRGLIANLTRFKSRDDLEHWCPDAIDKWMGPTYLDEIIKSGGGYIFSLTSIFIEDWDYIMEAIKRNERLRKNGGVWYELIWDPSGLCGLLILDHYHALAKIVHNPNADSDIYTVLNMLFENPNKLLRLSDIKEKRPGMTRTLTQILSSIRGIMEHGELKQMFFPIFSNNSIRVNPRIAEGEALALDVKTVEYLSSKDDSAKGRELDPHEYYFSLLTRARA